MVKNLVEWYKEFLYKRNLRRADGRSIASYDITEDEFDELGKQLAEKRKYYGRGLTRSSLGTVGCICFFIYSAQWWHRKYEGGPWRWRDITKSLGLKEDFFQNENARSDVISCAYRELRKEELKDEGKKYFGGIVKEGGIPLAMLKYDETENKLIKIFRSIIKELYYYEPDINRARRLIEKNSELLPRPLRENEFYNNAAIFVMDICNVANNQLLESINGGLYHKEIPFQHESKEIKNVVENLISNAREYKKYNINIVSSKRYIEIDCSNPQNFRIRHDVRIKTDSLAQYDISDLNKILKRSFNFQDDLNAKENATLYLKTRDKKYQVTTFTKIGNRLYPRSNENIFLCDDYAISSIYAEWTTVAKTWQGKVIMSCYSLNEYAPWIFHKENNDWVFLGDDDVVSDQKELLVVIPRDVDPVGTDYEKIGDVNTLERVVYKVRERFECTIKEQNFYIIANEQKKLKRRNIHYWFSGLQSEFDIEQCTFLGLPDVYFTEDGVSKRVEEEYLVWKSSNQFCDGERFGYSRVEIRLPDCRKRILSCFVIPKDGEIQIKPCLMRNTDSGRYESSIYFKDWYLKNIVPEYTGDTHQNLKLDFDEENEILLISTTERINYFIARLTWDGKSWIDVKLPFPFREVSFFNKGKVISNNSIIEINHFKNSKCRIIDHERGSHYSIHVCASSKNSSAMLKSASVDVQLSNIYTEINCDEIGFKTKLLFHRYNDIIDVDIFVRKNNKRVGNEFRVSRYSGVLKLLYTSENNVLIDIKDVDSVDAITELKAIPLLQVCEAPIQICLENGLFKIPETIKTSGGVWFIYSNEDLPIAIRPCIYVSDNIDKNEFHRPIQFAMSIQDSAQRKRALAECLDTELFLNFDNVNWIIIDNFKKWLWHLPLDVLDIWKVISKNPNHVFMLAIYWMISGHERVDRVLFRFLDEMGTNYQMASFDGIRKAICLGINKICLVPDERIRMFYFNYFYKQLSDIPDAIVKEISLKILYQNIPQEIYNCTNALVSEFISGGAKLFRNIQKSVEEFNFKDSRGDILRKYSDININELAKSAGMNVIEGRWRSKLSNNHEFIEFACEIGEASIKGKTLNDLGIPTDLYYFCLILNREMFNEGMLLGRKKVWYANCGKECGK